MPQFCLYDIFLTASLEADVRLKREKPLSPRGLIESENSHKKNPESE